MFCRFFQARISWRIEAGESLTPRLQRHIAACADCRRYYAGQLALTNLLSAQATQNRPVLSPFLHGKILAALHRDNPQPEPAWPLPRWATALAAVIAIAGVWLVLNQRTPRGSISPENMAHHSVNNDSPFGGRDLLVAIPKLNLAVVSARLDQPFADEANAVIADAKSAVQMLARNFLPSDR